MVNWKAVSLYLGVAGVAVAGSLLLRAATPYVVSRYDEFRGYWEPHRTDPLDERIAAYIETHPYEVLASLRGAEAAQSLARQHRQELLDDGQSESLGDPRGELTLVEFFDYRCAYCRDFALRLDSVLASSRHLRVIFKDYPILGPDSEYAARIAQVVKRHGKFPQFYRAMFLSGRPTPDGAAVDAVVRSLGLDPVAVRRDSHAAEVSAALERNRALAAALTIDATPSFVIGDEVWRGELPWDELERLQRRVASGAGNSQP